MSSLTLRGVTVNFPFPPYDCQKDYMNKVIECLQRKVNGVLESPTGTGKTLCLLCATLAWREHFKDTISARKIAEKLGGEQMFPNTPLASWGTAATDGDKPTYYTDVPKIIYASRTHSQLTQVINELKNTSYRPKVCVLGSREQLCINPEVMRQESNHVKRRALTETWACPYYLSRSLKQQADVIFMPYNYLLDPKSRRAHNIELNGAVVIFDEAHNVEKTCEESTSFDLTPYDIASAISAVDRLLVEQAKEFSEGVSEDINLESFSSDLKIDITAVAKIKRILLDLEAAIDSYDLPGDKGITKPGITKTDIQQALEQISGHLAGQTGIFLNTSGLEKLTNIIQLVFCGEPSEKDRQQQMFSNTAHFKVHIHRDTSQHRKKQNTDVWASSSSKKQGNILSYWCFSPGFSMQELVNQGVRSIILTSGTLSPLSSFTSEMRIEFPVCLENGHVIERDQIFVTIVDRGPDGVNLSSAFDRRFLPENMASLGNTVANLSRVVPHGLLVFFPSFPLMEKTLDFWRANGHAERIDNVKPMFVEPKGKGTFNEVIDGYYNKVNDSASKGGTFFAVCRGKMDPRVVLKMQFLDEMSRKKAPGLKYLSGQEWYRQQAFRAVNQAIGRVIRHKEDFGAIFLCDQRFKSFDARAQLPSWVRPYVRQYDGFGNVVRDVSQFFRVAQKLRPVVEKKAAAESCETVCLPDSVGSSGFASCSSSQSSVTQKAKVLDAHLPSLKRRRLNEPSRASGMARICIEYESEGQESQRKPANLLDALERGDHHGGEDSDAVVGEEKANHLSTLSLQYDKRMDNELRGGKRKIKLVQEQKTSLSEDVSEEGKARRAKMFLAEMKKSLSQVNFQQIIQALQTYKKTDNLDVLLTETAVLVEDSNTHCLLRGFYQFVRPHHKKRFDERCEELTGQGCGYKPDHSLPKDEKKALMLQTGRRHSSPPNTALSSDYLHAIHRKPAVDLTSSGLSTSSQLNTQQLNKGGCHLSQQGLREPQTRPAPKNDVHAAFLSDVKKALGPEKSAQLFQTIHSYKKTDNYENMVTTVVSLFTERDEDINLLLRFGMFIRPQHKKQYTEMLAALTGQSASSAAAAVSEDQQRQASSPPLRTQSKISSFFSGS
ncbi:hypothetical protein INR49_000543 [Caranx melampygus]|nr:hypothetical protein INR49_000543 [Caranx melampygus]